MYYTNFDGIKISFNKENLIEIINGNLDFLFMLGYNDIKKLKENDLAWLLYVFVCKDEKLRKKIYKEDEMIKRVGEKLKELNGKYDEDLFYDKEEFKKRAAYLQGIQDYKLEVAKSMIKEMPEINIDTLMRITHLTKEEIESLQKEINSKK